MKVIVMHFNVKWVPGGVQHLGDFLVCVSSCDFDEDYRRHRGCLHLNVFLARWKYIHVFLKEEVFSASSAERMNAPCFLSWKNQLDRRIPLLVLSHFSSWNSKSIIYNPPSWKFTKNISFLLSLIFFSVPTETVRMLNVHPVLTPSTPPQKLRIETFPPGAVTNAVP